MVVNIAACACVLVGAAVVGVRIREERHHEERIEQTKAALGAIRQEIARRAALEPDHAGATGWPGTLRAEWFADPPPQNALFDDGRAWVEIAGKADYDLNHPTVRCDATGGLAQFWYNPANGLIRARVPYAMNDAQTLALYNAVNDADATTLFPRFAGNDAKRGDRLGAADDHR